MTKTELSPSPPPNLLFFLWPLPLEMTPFLSLLKLDTREWSQTPLFSLKPNTQWNYKFSWFYLLGNSHQYSLSIHTTPTNVSRTIAIVFWLSSLPVAMFQTFTTVLPKWFYKRKNHDLYSFIYLTILLLLNTFYVPGAILSTDNKTVSKTDKKDITELTF